MNNFYFSILIHNIKIFLFLLYVMKYYDYISVYILFFHSFKYIVDFFNIICLTIKLLLMYAMGPIRLLSCNFCELFPLINKYDNTHKLRSLFSSCFIHHSQKSILFGEYSLVSEILFYMIGLDIGTGTYGALLE